MLPPEDRKYVLLVACLSAFLIPFTGSALNLAVPRIGAEFGLDAVTLNWIVTAYIISSAVTLLPLGRAADLFGRRRMFVLGLSLFSLFSLAGALAWSGAVLIAFRGLQGISGAMIFGTGMALLTSAFPAAERGRVLGLNVASVYTGLSLGPAAGGLLTYYAGWRSILWVMCLVSGAAAVVAGRKLPAEGPAADPVRYDLPGALLYTGGTALLMAGLGLLAVSPAGIWLTGAGAVLFALFLLMQTRRESPLLVLEIFRSRTFVFSNLAALIHYCATFATGYLISLYLQIVKGISPQKAGLILLVQPILMAVLSPMSGRLSDRIQPRLLATAGMTLTWAGLVLFAFLTTKTSSAAVMANLLFLGVGFALFSSPNTNAVMSSVERRHYGVGSATVGTMRMIGQALSMVLVSLVTGAYVGRVKLTAAHSEALVQSIRVSFTLFAVLGVLGIAASLARGRTERE